MGEMILWPSFLDQSQAPRRKVPLNGVLDLLIDDAIKLRSRSAWRFLDQQGSVIADFSRYGRSMDPLSFQLILDLDLNGDIEII
jgi:hypothetical protein